MCLLPNSEGSYVWILLIVG
uniref:Uncharacterized protein n=1 Tax=Anguilla anguilla TaxID=7936 RepID=A0A0E9XX47_ANGAN